jgi:hypothetical protein
MEQLQTGDRFPVRMGWTLPDGTRLRVTFQAEVEDLEPDKNRIRCRLLEIRAASGSRPEEEIDPLYLNHVMDLIGKRALIPLEARQGIVLPLRLATLIGEHHYFFD